VSLLIAIDCPSCHVSRETRLCGWQTASMRSYFVRRPTEIACQVCRYTEARSGRSFGDELSDARRGRTPGLTLTREEVAIRARALLRERGCSDEAIFAMRLVAD
jgi:hypothetical protein